MDQTLRETFEARAVRLSHAAPVFARMADGMLLSWRRALGVPDHAEPEVEAELARLRMLFDEQFLPEFCRVYTELLKQHLGSATSVVLGALEDERVQDYLAIAEHVEGDLSELLRECLPGIKSALARSTCVG